MNMKHSRAVGLSVLLLAVAGTAAAQISFYESESFRGRVFSTKAAVADFSRTGFNDRASSVVVEKGRWEVCEDHRFQGRCVVLRRGSYRSLADLGLENRISSVRPAAPGRSERAQMAPEPAMPEPYRWRRRDREALFVAPVTSVRAVVGQPTERCWVERQQVAQPASASPNVGGALIGGLLGGILGHQVGGGSGKNIATVGGAIAGAAIGSQVGTANGAAPQVQDVRRCTAVPNATPAYWDVSYQFRGVDHRVQMANPPPGNTVTVNAQGEPRD